MKIKEKFADLKKDYDLTKQDIMMGKSYDGQSFDYDKEVDTKWYEVIKEMIIWRYLFWKQERCNHEWEDNSYGGPETGYIDMTCIKCGKSVHERLY